MAKGAKRLRLSIKKDNKGSGSFIAYNKKEQAKVIRTIVKKSERKEERAEARRTVVRRNIIFRDKLNRATRSSDSDAANFSEISKAEAKLFYRYTQKIWEGQPSYKDRNQLIMEYYGTQSLEEAFKIVMETPEVKEALKKAGEPLENVAEGSPNYIMYLSALLQGVE